MQHGSTWTKKVDKNTIGLMMTTYYYHHPVIRNFIYNHTLVSRIHHEDEKINRSYLRKCLGRKQFFFQKQKYWYDFFQPQLFRLLTQCFDCHRQPSSGILGRLVLPLLISCLGEQAIPYVTSIQFMTGVVFRIHKASLIYLAFLLHDLFRMFSLFR